MSEKLLPIGTLVIVDDSVGTIVGHPGTDQLPEEHYAIWYGETTSDNIPRCRTVPIEYCVRCESIEYYH